LLVVKKEFRNKGDACEKHCLGSGGTDLRPSRC
jgi:hypothetical protein